MFDDVFHTLLVRTVPSETRRRFIRLLENFSKAPTSTPAQRREAFPSDQKPDGEVPLVSLYMTLSQLLQAHQLGRSNVKDISLELGMKLGFLWTGWHSRGAWPREVATTFSRDAGGEASTPPSLTLPYA